MRTEPSRTWRDLRRLIAEGESVTQALSRIDPYWGAQIVVAVALLLDVLLPEKLTIGPTWLLPGVEGVLLIGLVLVSPHPRVRGSKLRRKISMALIGLVSLVNIISLGLLVHYLLIGGHSTGKSLIGAGALLWLTNVLLFGLWFWQLDRGGPVERAAGTARCPDFMFPQMSDQRWAPPDWQPRLPDYLYVSFTNATAFSPTDAMPLTHAAKWLMSGQALTSLVTVGLVVARAVNILQG